MDVRRKRIVRDSALVTSAAVVLLGGFLWFDGMNDRELGRACGGMLSVDDVRAVLGDDHLEVRSRSREGTDTCEVEADGDGGSAEVTIVDTTRAAGSGEDDRISLPSLGQGDNVLAVPLGNGWSGTFGTDTALDGDGKATTALTLSCAKGSKKTSEGRRVEGLAVSVETDLGKTLDNPANRPAYVRIATGTATKAAKAYGCVTHLGHRSIRTVELPVTEEEFEPLTHTSGTCAGIPPTAGVTTARETARAGAPVETCLLSDDGLGNHRYALQAAFGAYAAHLMAPYEEEAYDSAPTPADAPKGRLPAANGYWATATCPADDGERAVFMVRRTEEGTGQRTPETDRDRAYERTALRAFTERSAKARGCSGVTSP